VFENDLAVITFLCKDFWTEVYGKQVGMMLLAPLLPMPMCC